MVLACLLMKLPESPKFLLSKGRYNETMDCLKFVYRWNNTSDEKFPVSPTCAIICTPANNRHFRRAVFTYVLRFVILFDRRRYR